MTGAACTQPGCGGTIEDGYCDVCGLAPAPPPPQPYSVPGANGGSIRYAGSTRQSGSGSGSGSGPSGSGTAGSWVTGLGSAGSGSGPGTRGSRSTSGRSGRGRLGAGLVEVPPVEALDPSDAILANPVVPENRRFCGKCGQLVGQPRDGRPGLTEGFCPNCRTRYSFSPKLAPRELVAGQYEVLGCLAHGGLGWIYLARDHHLNDKWVVLKGLLNTGDADAMAAAEAEGRFLAELDHPNIVRIYNFVQHTSHRDGETAGYIVMDYVGGKSLKEIRLDARQRGGAVPLAHALAYALEILPAFGYLHDRGLVYCDFKPDNIIQSEEQLKLIDMGGVRYIDDDGAIYGTVGYQAPEIENEGPSPSSDLYTVGRTLAVLTFEFTGFQHQYRFQLPDERAAAPAAGVLRPAAAPRHAPPPGPPVPDRRGDGRAADRRAARSAGRRRRPARPAFSGLFSPELRPVGTDLTPVPVNGHAANGSTPNGSTANGSTANGNGAAVMVAPPSPADVVAGLPAPLADGGDAAASYLASLASLELAAQAEALLGAVTGDASVAPEVAGSPETRLALVRALIGTGDLAAAKTALDELAPAVRNDWRIAWYTGLCELAAASPAGRARRSAPSTTSCRANSRPSSPSASPPRPPATSPPRGTTSSWCGRSTAPTSAPGSAPPGPTSRPATGSPPSPLSPPSPRPPATMPPRRSPPSGCLSPAGRGCPPSTCSRPTSASAGWPSKTTTRAGTSLAWRSCAPRSTGCP